MDEERESRDARVSVTQQEMMVSFMERHPQMKARMVCSREDRVRSQLLWAEMTCRLNEAGPSKVMFKWKKVWNDWRNKVKRKDYETRHPSQDFGQKAKNGVFLSDLEKRVLRIVSNRPVSDTDGRCEEENEVIPWPVPSTVPNTPETPKHKMVDNNFQRRKKRKLCGGVLEEFLEGIQENNELLRAVHMSVTEMTDIMRDMVVILKQIKNK